MSCRGVSASMELERGERMSVCEKEGVVLARLGVRTGAGADIDGGGGRGGAGVVCWIASLRMRLSLRLS